MIREYPGYQCFCRAGDRIPGAELSKAFNKRMGEEEEMGSSLSRSVGEGQVRAAKGSHVVRVGEDTDTRSKPRDRTGSQQQS